jgi:hypothetical protein
VYGRFNFIAHPEGKRVGEMAYLLSLTYFNLGKKVSLYALNVGY